MFVFVFVLGGNAKSILEYVPNRQNEGAIVPEVIQMMVDIVAKDHIPVCPVLTSHNDVLLNDNISTVMAAAGSNVQEEDITGELLKEGGMGTGSIGSL